MSKKCLSCRHYGNHFTNLNDQPGRFETGWCTSLPVNDLVESAGYIVSRGSNVDIETAREICDHEGNGIMVHFEPKTPSAGAVVGESRVEFELDRLGQTGLTLAAAGGAR